MVITKIQTVLGANSYAYRLFLCLSYRVKTGREVFLTFIPLSISSILCFSFNVDYFLNAAVYFIFFFLYVDVIAFLPVLTYSSFVNRHMIDDLSAKIYHPFYVFF